MPPPRFSPVAGSDLDLVPVLPVAALMGEQRAAIVSERDARYSEVVFLGIAAKGERNRVAEGDAGRQVDVMVVVTRAGNEPIAAYGQHARPAWSHCLYGGGRRGGRIDAAGNDQQPG
jgi:hypothetical protein